MEKADLRVQKTHRAIRTAFIELLQTKPYEKIAVQDILARALVNRTTFYKYYAGKSGLAGKMIADFKIQYADMLAQRFAEKDLPQLMIAMPKVLFEQRQMLLALWKINTKRHHLYQDMFELIRDEFIRYAAARNPPSCHGDFSYQGHMLATLVLTTAKYHFEQHKPVDFIQAQGQIRQMLDIIQYPPC